MAIFEQSAACKRLAALQGVTVMPDPLPFAPDVLALVMQGVRCWRVRAEGDDFGSAFRLGLGEWLPLASSVNLDLAFDAIALHVGRIGHLHGGWDPEVDAAERLQAIDIHATIAAQVRGRAAVALAQLQTTAIAAE